MALVGRRAAPLEEVASKITEIGGRALVVSGDVSDPASAKNIVDQTISHFGSLNYAVNNAGVSGENQKLADIPVDTWHNVMNINLNSVFYCMKK
ncbi:SDR family NAD(P)-dependent oxidoreductase [Paenibacillus sp. GCM10023250]|uniref:SDR family NAD(P)-dependent oxidoreductase n=1 Tax=Paenibacillus sp. GCM10023250 TaxID=3252648 RepID=UPI003613D739